MICMCFGRTITNYVRYAPLACVLLVIASTGYAQQCSFTSPSDGSDGTYDLTGTPAGSTVYFNASNFHGSGVANNVFNFNKVIIPANVTVKFSENVFHGPVYWLAQSDVTIAGTLDLSGDNGANDTTDVTTRIPAAGGSGGYPGGVGGGGPTGLAAAPGSGPGGGAAAPSTAGAGSGGASRGAIGTFVGSNDFLVPLVGGSGGGGSFSTGSDFQNGGGGGGGAILIASSTSIKVATINAEGGGSGYESANYSCGGGGSGGAVHLISTSINAPGPLYVAGGSTCGATSNNSGLMRLEACTFVAAPQNTPVLLSTPSKVFVPTSPIPAVQVTSVNGIAINANPFTFPDISINSASSIPVVITAHQVPVGTVPTLFIFSETGDQKLTCAAGLQGTLDTTTCTINLTFPFGGSRGFVKATWSQ